MLKNDITAIEEQFNQECTVIELKYEYPGYTGTEKYAIVTELSQAEIEFLYSEQIQKYVPYLILNEEFLKIRNDFLLNEDKAVKRIKNKHDAYGYEEGEMEQYHSELALQDFSDSLIENIYLRELMGMLPEQQYRRIFQYYFEGRGLAEIAENEGVSHQSISKSIRAGLKFMKKISIEGLQNTPSHSK